MSRTLRPIASALAAVVLAAGVSMVVPHPAGAAPHDPLTPGTIVVNHPFDIPADGSGVFPADGLCSLRAALTNAKRNDGAADVDCAPGRSDAEDVVRIDYFTVQVGSVALPVVEAADGPLVVEGGVGGRRRLTPAPGATDPSFQVEGGHLTLRHLELSDPSPGTPHPADGGVVRATGGATVVVDDSVVEGHSAGRGGFAYVQDSLLEVQGSNVHGNSADQGGFAFLEGGGRVTVTDSNLVDNQAGTGSVVAAHTDGTPTEPLVDLDRSFVSSALAEPGEAVVVDTTDGSGFPLALDAVATTVTGFDGVLRTTTPASYMAVSHGTFVDTGVLVSGTGLNMIGDSILSGVTCDPMADPGSYLGRSNLLEPGVDADDCGVPAMDPRGAVSGLFGFTVPRVDRPELVAGFALRPWSNAVDTAASCPATDGRGLRFGVGGGDLALGGCDVGALEFAVGVLQWADTSLSVPEGAGDVTASYSLQSLPRYAGDVLPQTAVVASFATDSTATAGSAGDLVPPALVPVVVADGFPGGSSIVRVNDDAVHEGDEVAHFDLVAFGPIAVSDRGRFTLTVVDDDPAPPTPNRNPVATPGAVDAFKGEPVSVTLGGTDPDGDDLECLSVPGPTAQGTVLGSGCDVQYVASPGAQGTDAVRFRVLDEHLAASAEDQVTVTIVNRPPTALDRTVTVRAGESTTLELGGSDPDPGEGATLACEVTPGPTPMGSVVASGCGATYTAGPDAGTDSFPFAVDDGFGGTDAGTVTVQVEPADEPDVAPSATAQGPITVFKGGEWTIELAGTDPEGGPITCEPQLGATAKGVVSGDGCTVVYSTARSAGADSFTFVVRDAGGQASAPATVLLDIANRAPSAPDRTLTVAVEKGAAIDLGGTDPDPGETEDLSCTVATASLSRGSASVEGCRVTYTAGHPTGTDTFTYTVDDGFGGVHTATVTVSVTLPGCTDSDPQNARYVCRVYLDVLGRAADAGGKAYWVDRLHAGGSRQLIVRQFLGTSENRRTVVRAVYRTLLGREATVAERDAGAEALRTGADPDALRASLLGSGEFWTGSGATAASFADALYAKVVRRPATPAERSAVASALARGTTRTALAATVLGVDEADAITIAEVYERFLRRSPPAAETTFWVGRLQGGSTESSLVRQIVGSREFFDHS